MVSVEVGSFWKHKKSLRVYKILFISNSVSEDVNKFPLTISYRSLGSENIWSRPYKDFLEKFELVKRVERYNSSFIAYDGSLLPCNITTKEDKELGFLIEIESNYMKNLTLVTDRNIVCN